MQNLRFHEVDGRIIVKHGEAVNRSAWEFARFGAGRFGPW